MNRKKWESCISLRKMEQFLKSNIKRNYICNALKKCNLSESQANTVNLLERFIDGEVEEEEIKEGKLEDCIGENWSFLKLAFYYGIKCVKFPNIWSKIGQFSYYVSLVQPLDFPKLVRELHNPYHKSKFYNSQVQNLARLIYKTQSYEDYPVLHDMLLDFGCKDEELLKHLLEKEHERGCWGLDSLLWKP